MSSCRSPRCRSSSALSWATAYSGPVPLMSACSVALGGVDAARRRCARRASSSSAGDRDEGGADRRDVAPVGAVGAARRDRGRAHRRSAAARRAQRSKSLGGGVELVGERHHRARPRSTSRPRPRATARPGRAGRPRRGRRSSRRPSTVARVAQAAAHDQRARRRAGRRRGRRSSGRRWRRREGGRCRRTGNASLSPSEIAARRLRASDGSVSDWRVRVHDRDLAVTLTVNGYCSPYG